MTLPISGLPNLVVSRSTLTGIPIEGLPNSVTMDGAGNSYVASYGNAHLTKYNSDLVPQWSKKLSVVDYLTAVTYDASSGYIYTAGFNNSGTTSNDVVLIKWDSSGNIIWSVIMIVSGSQVGYSITTDSSGNIYVGGYIIPSSYNYPYTVKFDSNGNYIWNQYLTFSGAATSPWGSMAYNSYSGSIMQLGWLQNSATAGSNLLVASIGTNGTYGYVNQLNFGTSSGLSFSGTPDIHADSSGNIYLSGSINVSGSYESFVAKIQSGSVVWFKAQYLSGSAAASNLACYVDSSGNIYQASSITGTTWVTKWDTNGNVLYTKYITTSGNSVSPYNIKTYGGFVYVYYTDGGSNQFSVFRFPDTAVSFSVTESGSGITVSSTSLSLLTYTPTSYSAYGGTNTSAGGLTRSTQSVTASDSGYVAGSSVATVQGSILNAISMSQIDVELGASASALITLNDTAARALAGKPSGSISLFDFFGKSARVSASVTISAAVNNYVANTAKISGYVAGSTDATFTINSGVVVGSGSTGCYAFKIDSSWASGDTVKVINSGQILGAGGTGGNGGCGGNGYVGGAGGAAVQALRAVTFTNAGTVGGGGGGGGGAGGWTVYCSKNSRYAYYAGGSGGGGAGYVVGTAGTFGQNIGASGTTSAGGAGGTAVSGGAGGAGGSLGAAGSAGGSGASGSGGAGGAAGAALVGKTYVNAGAGISGTVYGGQS